MNKFGLHFGTGYGTAIEFYVQINWRILTKIFHNVPYRNSHVLLANEFCQLD